MINIGHIPSLEQIKNKNYKTWRLKLTNGDRSNCPHARQSEVRVYRFHFIKSFE